MAEQLLKAINIQQPPASTRGAATNAHSSRISVATVLVVQRESVPRAWCTVSCRICARGQRQLWPSGLNEASGARACADSGGKAADCIGVVMQPCCIRGTGGLSGSGPVLSGSMYCATCEMSLVLSVCVVRANPGECGCLPGLCTLRVPGPLSPCGTVGLQDWHDTYS